jgi:hypothetical protein
MLFYRLVFSQSLLSLDLIEDFLAHWDKPLDSEDEFPVGIIPLKPDIINIYGGLN